MRLPCVQTDVPSRAVISLGRSQWNLSVRGLPVRRRTSGGGAVLVGPWMLRALVVLPRTHPWLRTGPAGAAQRFGEMHREWLAGIGIATQPYAGPLIDHWSCFAGRASGELLVADRKITGIAQTWHRRRALLWSGTLLAAPPWAVLAGALGRPDTARELELSATSVQDVLHVAPDAATWARTLRHACARAVSEVAPM